MMPLSVGAAADWLRSLLKIDNAARNRTATHSCKASLLSMCAKFGLDHSTRRILGYHTESRDRSMIIYSRDAISAPLRKMQSMLRAVRLQQFFPDATRSGYFPSDALPEDASMEQQSDGSGDETNSSRGSLSEEDVNHEEDEAVVSEIVGKWDPKGADDPAQQFARHRISRCIHSMADESGQTFTCGRTVNSRYIVLLSKPPFMHPLCNGCFRA